MAQEIKRNNWSRFCKRFSSSNQYRQTTMFLSDSTDKKSLSFDPFMGMTLTKKGRLIDGIRIYAGGLNPDTVLEPVVTLKDPEKILVEKTNDGQERRLNITCKDGTEVNINIAESDEQTGFKTLTRRIAYGLFERGGYHNGNDMGDWFAAEERVREAASQLAE
ncbi:MAG: hypothetical protein R3F48_15240 [Candidatus Zixiibacteriota bacterium]